uniref:Uncharacterized protein n=1 Tax=Amphimedon queenslandica TaxID=400682 RepID=A0A1X7VGJ4_AMPQE
VLAWHKDYNVVLKILAMEYVVHILHKDFNVVRMSSLISGASTLDEAPVSSYTGFLLS